VLKQELASVQQAIRGKERELRDLIPLWEHARAKETAEKRKMEEARAQLNALFAKQGRVNRFRTKADRDVYLKQEIASMEAYQRTRSAALKSTQNDVAQTNQNVSEMERRVENIQGSLEDGRIRVKDIGEQLAALKDQHSELSERRKDLWREDTKLDGLLAHAGEELRAAERNLASMMDKVSICYPQIIISFIVVGHWLWSPLCRQDCRATQPGGCIWPTVPSLRDTRLDLQHCYRTYCWKQVHLSFYVSPYLCSHLSVSSTSSSIPMLLHKRSSTLCYEKKPVV